MPKYFKFHHILILKGGTPLPYMGQVFYLELNSAQVGTKVPMGNKGWNHLQFIVRGRAVKLSTFLCSLYISFLKLLGPTDVTIAKYKRRRENKIK